MLDNAFKKGSLLMYFELEYLVDLKISAEEIYKNWIRIEKLIKKINSEKSTEIIKKTNKIKNMLSNEEIELDLKIRSNNNRIEIGQLTTRVIISFNKLKDYEKAYHIACFGVSEDLFCYSGKSFQERKDSLQIKIKNRKI